MFPIWFAIVSKATLLFCTTGLAQDESATDLSKLPGGTTDPIGHVESKDLNMGAGPECEKFRIVVPENRRNRESRGINLVFYRIKARNESNFAPVFFLPGGPGGSYVDDWLDGLRNGEPESRGSNYLAWLLTEDRDVILVNQRGARLPDRRYAMFAFMNGGKSLGKPYSREMVDAEMTKGAKRSLDHWASQGMDLAGYDIANMVEDINDIRKAMDYKKISLLGSSFGSQWSFAFMKQHPKLVERAVLSGVELLDHGYDSHTGIWNVFKRIEKELIEANGQGNDLNLPNVTLTQAIKAIVERLEDKPIEVEGTHPRTKKSRVVPINHQDFQLQLRSGIAAGRETAASLENFHRFVYEVYREDYRYLASKTIQQRGGMSGGPLQFILIDNSLGISAKRDEVLSNEPARRWLGELNSVYKATREVTPTPVIRDSQRILNTDIPILFVHGDMDLSTPIENATEAMEHLSNCHMIRIKRGTHGASKQIARHNLGYFDHLLKFVRADFRKTTVKELNLPVEMQLPKLKFKPVGKPALVESYQN
jgi:pimeloyl-ACP methyl ester carboxylesterase